MFDYDSIKELGARIRRPVKNLLALTEDNDPFYAGLPRRRIAAEWFAGIWEKYCDHGSHLRRIHYILVSQSSLVPLPKVIVGEETYQNLERHYDFLVKASGAARYLGLIPCDGIVDARNDEARLYAINADLNPNEPRAVEAWVCASANIPVLEFPDLPSIEIDGLEDGALRQDFVLEVWIEKSTQNDWLDPLCKRRGVNLITGTGELSETRCRELAQRAADYAVPARIIYVADFDPGGQDMPKSVARKVQFSLMKFGFDDVDLQLIPFALTPQQIRHYKLPPTPIKDSEKRKDSFLEKFGVQGATELDALEALYPGELARLLSSEFDNFLDRGLERRIHIARSNLLLPLRQGEHEVLNEHKEEIDEIKDRFDKIVADVQALKEDADALWDTMHDDLEQQLPDLSDVESPRSQARGETDSFVLYDSKRDYLTQMDFYNQWKEGGHDDGGEADAA